MADIWSHDSFEINGIDGYAGMEIMADGSLEIHACHGTYEDRHGYERDDHVTMKFAPDQAPGILAGIQAWIEQLPQREKT